MGFRPEIGTGAGCSGAGTGREGLVRECGIAGKTATPSPALPTRQPQAAALCLSRKMVWESLRGREGRPHHSPLNVNYAFKTVFIGEAARHPMPLAPCACSLGQRCGQLATRRRYGEARPAAGAGAREEEGRACGPVVSPCGRRSWKPRGRCARWSPSCRGRMHTVSAGEAVGWDGSVCAVAVTLSL